MSTPLAPPPPTMHPEPVASAPAARPVGVSILAVVAFIAAGAAVLFALGAVLFGAMIGSLVGQRGGAAMGTAIGMMIAFSALAFAAVSGLTGYGLWNARSWGWVLGLVWGGLWALGGALRFLGRDASGIVGLALGGAILWYLLQPGVKGWFGRA